jgi:hypothetical protein
MSKTMKAQEQVEKIETIVWETKVSPTKQENIILFPLRQESTVQERSIPSQGETVKLKIVSSGFSKTNRSSATRMQLAA